MKSLILDSATKNLYCAIVIDEKLMFEKYLEGQNDHAKAIVQLVADGCETSGIDLVDLDEIICGIGPGSYTGVRMAVTVTKMVASLADVGLKTISTLYLMASGSQGLVSASIDARRGNAFMAVYDDGKELLKEGLYQRDQIKKTWDTCVTESSFLVNPFKVLEYASPVENPFLVVPNYLRETEAERNLHHEN